MAERWFPGKPKRDLRSDFKNESQFGPASLGREAVVVGHGLGGNAGDDQHEEAADIGNEAHQIEPAGEADVVQAARGQGEAAEGAGFMGFNQRMLEAMRLLGQQMATS